MGDVVFANLFYGQEHFACIWMVTGYPDIPTGPMRLIFGNLAISVDHGADLHFCQILEFKLGLFRKTKSSSIIVIISGLM